MQPPGSDVPTFLHFTAWSWMNKGPRSRHVKVVTTAGRIDPDVDLAAVTWPETSRSMYRRGKVR